MAEIEVEFSWDQREMRSAFEKLEREAQNIIRGMSVEFWNSILARTPQFLGRMAASWSYSFDVPQFYDRSNQVDVSFVGDVGTTQYKRRGDNQAIEIAEADNKGSDAGFKLGQTIWIANGVDHGEGEYSAAIELGQVQLRSVNLPGAPVSRSIDMMERRYGNDVTPAAAERLKKLRI